MMDSFWYFQDMRPLASPVPAYGLYGDADASALDAFFHCETIAVRSARYDWAIAPHLHTALSQILFVASGRIDLHLDGADHAHRGPLLVRAPRGHVHGFRFSPDVVGFVVTVSQDFLDGLARQDGLRVQLAQPAISVPAGDLAADLLAIGDRLVAAERRRFDPNMHRLHRALGEAWLRTAIQPGLAGDAPPESLAQRFQALVEAHFRDHRPVAFYADRLHCTVRTLSRQCREAFGMSPLQCINRRLLFEARRLLRFTHAGCGEVAAELGFDDPAYFSRFFRRMTGTSPSDARGGTDERRRPALSSTP